MLEAFQMLHPSHSRSADGLLSTQNFSYILQKKIQKKTFQLKKNQKKCQNEKQFSLSGFVSFFSSH